LNFFVLHLRRPVIAATSSLASLPCSAIFLPHG
jgi:hypothetical protein